MNISDIVYEHFRQQLLVRNIEQIGVVEYPHKDIRKIAVTLGCNVPFLIVTINNTELKLESLYPPQHLFMLYNAPFLQLSKNHKARRDELSKIIVDTCTSTEQYVQSRDVEYDRLYYNAICLQQNIVINRHFDEFGKLYTAMFDLAESTSIPKSEFYIHHTITKFKYSVTKISGHLKLKQTFKLFDVFDDARKEYERKVLRQSRIKYAT